MKYLGTAHVADMYEPAPTDPPSLTAARLVTSAYIGRLLDERPAYYKSPVFIIPSESSAISDSSNNPGVIAPHYNLNQTLGSFHSQNSTFIDPNFVGASVEAGGSKIMRFSKSPQLQILKGEPGRRGGPRRTHKDHPKELKKKKDDKKHKKGKKNGKKHHQKPVSSSANSSSSDKKNKKGKKKHHPKKHYHGGKHFEPSRTGNTRSFTKPGSRSKSGSGSVPTASPLNSFVNSNPNQHSFMRPFKSISLNNLNKSPVMANSTSAAQPAPMPSGAVPQQSGSPTNANNPASGSNPANGSNPTNGTLANAQSSQNPSPPPPRAHRRPSPRHRSHGRSRKHRHPHHASGTSSSSESKHHKHKIGVKRGAPRRPMRLRHPPRFPGGSSSSSNSPSSSNGGSSSPGSSSTSSTTSATKATSSGSSSSST